MNKRTILIVVALAVVATYFSPNAEAEKVKKSGLIGAQYGSEDFTNLQNLSRLDSLERAFSEDDDYGREWSGRWVGFITAPASGEVTFGAETDRSLQIQIAGKRIVVAKQGRATGSFTMVKGTEYPIEVSYVKEGDSYDSYFKVMWSWAGQEKVSIPAANLMHTAEQEQQWVQKAEQAEDDDDNDIEGGADWIGQRPGVSKASDAGNAQMPGLVGVRFGEPDLTNRKNAEVIDSLEHLWTENDDRGGSWSSRWRGYIVAPATGEITFHAETNKKVTIEIGGKERLRIPGEVDACRVFEFLQYQTGHMERTATMSMVEGKLYPIKITYVLEDGSYGYLRVKWRWQGQDKVFIPGENLRHTAQQERDVNWERERPVDRSRFVTVPVRHVMVYNKPGRFAGWPANDGLWSWGDEILVGFHEGTYQKTKKLSQGHYLNRGQPRRELLARSLDGGETWMIEDPENYAGDGGKVQPCPGNINFTHPDFAMHCRGAEFRISYDRGKTWQGPYKLPDIGRKLSARTDYVVNGPKECLFFLSAEEKRVEAVFQDRAFCAGTADGGKTIDFVSWMTHEPISVRSVMPSTVRCSQGHLVSALRRRLDIHLEGDVDYSRDWIDMYQSKDGGKTWRFLSKVADTETDDANEEERNGNPPSLIRLKDGRLCVTYGYREDPYGIRAKLSCDNGKTWSEEIHLRDDGRTWDLGYTRTVQRPDGKLVTIYYFTTQENKEQHIAATIWDPGKVR